MLDDFAEFPSCRHEIRLLTGQMVSLVRPADTRHLDPHDRVFVNALVELFTTYRRLPQEHHG